MGELRLPSATGVRAGLRLHSTAAAALARANARNTVKIQIKKE